MTAAKVDLESAGEAFAAQREPAHKPAPVALLCGRLLLLLQVRDGPPECEKRSGRPSWRSKAVRGAAGWARWKHVSSAPCRVARELARRRWISMRGPWRCSGGRSPNSEETTERRRSIPVPSRVELDATRPEPLEPCGKRGGPRPRVVLVPTRGHVCFLQFVAMKPWSYSVRLTYVREPRVPRRQLESSGCCHRHLLD